MRSWSPAVILTGAAVAVAACSSSDTGPVEHLQPPKGYWNHPLMDQGRSVALDRAQEVGRLSFAPAVPRLPVDPRRVEVLRHPARSHRKAATNSVDLVYRLPRSWGFETGDTRVVVRESGAEKGDGDFSSFAEENAFPLVELGDGVQGVLIQGAENDVTVGRVIFVVHGIHVDITGPAVPPAVTTTVARRVVAAAP